MPTGFLSFFSCIPGDSLVNSNRLWPLSKWLAFADKFQEYTYLHVQKAYKQKFCSRNTYQDWGNTYQYWGNKYSKNVCLTTKASVYLSSTLYKTVYFVQPLLESFHSVLALQSMWGGIQNATTAYPALPHLLVSFYSSIFYGKFKSRSRS